VNYSDTEIETMETLGELHPSPGIIGGAPVAGQPSSRVEPVCNLAAAMWLLGTWNGWPVSL
jgi:hypothetical protein